MVFVCKTSKKLREVPLQRISRKQADHRHVSVTPTNGQNLNIKIKRWWWKHRNVRRFFRLDTNVYVSQKCYGNTFHSSHDHFILSKMEQDSIFAKSQKYFIKPWLSCCFGYLSYMKVESHGSMKIMGCLCLKHPSRKSEFQKCHFDFC